MIEIAGWIAPAATMIAAMMTAANLGARVTGWGFVLFSVGAVAWVIVALGSGQQNLLWSNAFLLVVDLVGIWRWLGRQARYDAAAEAARLGSKEAAAPTLFPLSKLEGRPVVAADGSTLGTVVEAMARCDRGGIVYLVVRQGGLAGVGERLHALGWGEVEMTDDAIASRVDAARMAQRPTLDPVCWPATAEAAGVR